jgi:stearoyl-CoA desaturase (delta-9 desaturase)
MNFLTSSTRGAQIFILTSLLFSLLGLFLYGIDLKAFYLIILGYFCYGCLGIVVTFHRKLTHNSYETNKTLTKIFSILGCFAGTGSPLAWVAIHLNHHLKSDKPGDPHSPLYKGLKIFTLDYVQEVDSKTKWKMRHLVTDAFQQFLHRYYFAILILWSLFLYFIGGLYLMVFFHLLPAFITAIMSNVVNYVGHRPNWLGAFRRYNLNDQSSNNWIWALPSWGESWHNNHHRHPKKYSLGEKWWEIDISAIIIRLIKY